MDKAKVFMNGKSQAVRLPKKYRFQTSEVLVQDHPAGVLLIDPKKRWDLMEKIIEHYAEEDLKRPTDLPWTKREKIL